MEISYFLNNKKNELNSRLLGKFISKNLLKDDLEFLNKNKHIKKSLKLKLIFVMIVTDYGRRAESSPPE